MNISTSTAEPADYLKVLIETNRAINPPAEIDSCLRQINFMSYELVALCKEDSPCRSLQRLNEFLFDNKKFRIQKYPVLIEEVLAQRSGATMAFALLYMHLARAIQLKLELIQWPLHAILKWINEDGKTAFIDLEQKGKILSEEELLLMVNKHAEHLNSLCYREAVLQYLEAIANHFDLTGEHQLQHRALNFMLYCEPENTRYLAERAVLRHRLALYREALADFKRLFAFVDHQAIPADLARAYEDVKAACVSSPPL